MAHPRPARGKSNPLADYRKRVVVQKAYLDLLIEKAELLDGVFTVDNFERRAEIEQADFERVKKFAQRFENVDCSEFDYVEPKGS